VKRKAVVGVLLLVACVLPTTGCGASHTTPRAPLSVVRVSSRTPRELARLLSRPVRVPKGCRLATPVHLGKWGWTLGRWPLHAIMNRLRNSAHESFELEPTSDKLHGWWYAKVLWFAPKTYHGWLLLRGIGLDRSSVGFLEGGEVAHSALKLDAHATPAYPPPGQRYFFWTTATVVPRLGCYAYQVDGRTFSYSIVVQADH
jgi:hypothetical protein